MKNALYVVCGFCLLLGIAASIDISDNFQLVVVAVSFIGAVICFAAGAVVRAVDRLREQLLGRR